MISLPLPPTINSYYSQSIVGRRYKTGPAREWETEAGYLLLNHKKYGNKKIKVTYYFFMSNWNSDYDNRLKILNDLLEKQNIIDNDNQIIEAHIYKSVDFENPRVELEIKAL
jgi:Holliday junction resolvase RusA-like endonuclease